MKASTMFGFLAMLSSQALALELNGRFTVASAGTQLYLREGVSGQITFSEESPQDWFFIEAEIDRYAIVNNVTNNYINCGSAEGAICEPSNVAQLFQIENISDNVYTFSDPESKLLLHRTSENELDLSRPTPTNDESFELTQLQL